MIKSYGVSCYWRFKKDGRAYRYGWPTHDQKSGLVRMGVYNGDTTRGPLVDETEIETK